MSETPRKPAKLCQVCQENQYRVRIIIQGQGNYVNICRACIKLLIQSDQPVKLVYNSVTVLLSMRKKYCRFCGGAGRVSGQADAPVCGCCGGQGEYPIMPYQGSIHQDPEQLMARAVAARCFVDAAAGFNPVKNKEDEVYAFLSVFHPEMDHAQKRDFLRSMRD